MNIIDLNFDKNIKNSKTIMISCKDFEKKIFFSFY